MSMQMHAEFPSLAYHMSSSIFYANKAKTEMRHSCLKHLKSEIHSGRKILPTDFYLFKLIP